jgi:hypothetical protein
MPNAVNSLFTQHLLAGLRGGVAGDDGLIRIFDLFEFVQPRVTGDNLAQHPVFKADLEQNFPLALKAGGQKSTPQPVGEPYQYDVYISYIHQEPDAGWVWRELVPRLKEAGLAVAVSGTVEEPGVALVLGIERAIQQSRRMLLVLSPAYVRDQWAAFQNEMGQHLSIEERKARLCPVIMAPFDQQLLRGGLQMLAKIDLTDSYLKKINMERLISTLKSPL